jgi:hypothetical protein
MIGEFRNIDPIQISKKYHSHCIHSTSTMLCNMIWPFRLLHVNMKNAKILVTMKIFRTEKSTLHFPVTRIDFSSDFFHYFVWMYLCMYIWILSHQNQKSIIWTSIWQKQKMKIECDWIRANQAVLYFRLNHFTQWYMAKLWVNKEPIFISGRCFWEV